MWKENSILEHLNASLCDALVLGIMGAAARTMIEAGRLHEALQLTQQAMPLGRQLGELILPEVGWPALFQAEILRERNELDAALRRHRHLIPSQRQSAWPSRKAISAAS